MTVKVESIGRQAVVEAGRRWREGRLRSTRISADTLAPVAILITLAIGFAIAAPQFLSVSNLRTLGDSTAIPLTVATGLTFVILMGSIDLSTQGVIATVSVSVSLLLANTTNGNDFGWLGVAAGVGLGMLFGFANGVIYTKARLPSLIVTLGMWFIGLGIATYLFPGEVSVVQDGAFRNWALDRWWGLERLDYVAVLIFLLLLAVSRRTVFGRMLLAIGGAEGLVRLAGVKVDRFKIAAFTISGGLAGVAGLMATAQLGTGRVDAGNNTLFPAISAIVVGGTLLSGGRGGLIRTLLGVLILSVLQDGMILVGVSPYIQQALIGALIVFGVAAATWRQRDRLRVVK